MVAVRHRVCEEHYLFFNFYGTVDLFWVASLMQGLADPQRVLESTLTMFDNTRRRFEHKIKNHTWREQNITVCQTLP